MVTMPPEKIRGSDGGIAANATAVVAFAAATTYCLAVMSGRITGLDGRERLAHILH